MKITSGRYNGFKIFSPPGRHTRPSLARVRQAVFNMLREKLAGSTVIDCFAGTGAYGLEALSNEAEKVLFIDDSTRELIEKNLRKTGAGKKQYEIFSCSFQKALQKIHQKGITAEIFMADPPYNKGYASKILKNTQLNGILIKGSLCVLEVHKSEAAEIETPDFFRKIKEKNYSDTHVIIFEKAV
ncbi:MAG: 16S rRNA (guanine(966)-N(2))-methyltransferase RsmD [Candidatus Goldiibacteriota bacterium]